MSCMILQFRHRRRLLLVLLAGFCGNPIFSGAQGNVRNQSASTTSGVRRAAQGSSAITASPNVSHTASRVRPFYTVHKESQFYHMARRHRTDKAVDHRYEALYTKYFEAQGATQRFQPYKILEIGLGCTMSYGAGRSARLWREYFPNAELWFGEFNRRCVERHKQKLDAMGVRVVTGNQGDPGVLRRWVKQTGGDFDIIIDDGGHSNMQQFTSLTVLMKSALKPGGIYFVEDLQVSRWGKYVDGGSRHVMIKVIKDWLEGIVMSWTVPSPVTGVPSGIAGVKAHCDHMAKNNSVPYLPHFRLPDRIQFIDCSAEMCAFVKCMADDDRCPYGLPQGPYEGRNGTMPGCDAYKDGTPGVQAG